MLGAEKVKQRPPEDKSFKWRRRAKEAKNGQKVKKKKLELWLFPAYQAGPEPNSLLLGLWDKAELASYKFHQYKCEECGDECGEVFVPKERAQ